MRLDGFIGPGYQSASIRADCQRSLNLFPEVVESGKGKNSMYLLGTPGVSTWITLPASPIRGILAAGAPLTTGARLFVVAGATLYEVFANGTFTARGSVGNDGLPVQMMVNGNQLFVVSAGTGYIDNGVSPISASITLGRGIVTTVNSGGQTAVTLLSGDSFGVGMIGQILVLGGTGYSGGVSYTVAASPAPTLTTLYLTTNAGANPAPGIVYNVPTSGLSASSGAFLDGYFIVANVDSKQFNISNINDGTYWRALDFGVKQGYPDNIGKVLVDHRDLWLFGSETTEVWRNTGAANFPFERDPSGYIQQGIAAPNTACSLANGVAWLGGDSRGNIIAWYAQGYQPMRISTHAIEQAWQGYSVISDAVSFTYQENGHQFWVINFPAGMQTWVYDFTAKLWHERGYWTGAVIQRGRANCHAYCYGHHIVGDWTNGNLYYQSLATFTDDGAAIYRIRTAPHISNEDKEIFYHRFRLDAENTGALNPALDWSNDGGFTFINSRTTVSNTAGAMAVYDWRRLGKARDRVFRLIISSGLKTALIDAYLETTPGTS